MNERSITIVGLLLVLLVVAGCAGRPPLPPAATLPSFHLVKDESGIADASKKLDAAAAQDRPALLLARTKEAVAAGQKIRNGLGIIFSGASPGYDKFLAFYDLAYRDLEEIAVRYPKAPEAPEARFLLGLIHDYPHLDAFDEAVGQYFLTIELYPGTEWAQKAADRIRKLETIRRGGNMTTPGEAR